MITCKDCIHYEVCLGQIEKSKALGIPILWDMDWDLNTHYCSTFQDKSKVIELPCKAGGKFYVCCQQVIKGEPANCYFLDERELYCFEIHKNEIYVIDYDGFDFPLDEFNKYWFTNKAKALERLEELNGGTNS